MEYWRILGEYLNGGQVFSASEGVCMYVDSDRGFGVVAFHFDPSECATIVKEHTGSRIELFAKVLVKSVPVHGEIISSPDGAVRGAVNVANAMHQINLSIIESLQRFAAARVEQNDPDHAGSERDHQSKPSEPAASRASDCSAFGQ